MRRYTLGRDRIINYIGLRGGFPVLERTTGEPAILRPDDDESRHERVGWPAFFAAVERRGYAFVYDPDSEGLDYRFVPRRELARDPGLAHSSWVKHTLETLRGLPVVRHA